MSEHPFLPPPLSDTLPERDAPDPRIARAEQRLAMLRELAELGMALTRALARRALEAPDVDPEAVPEPRHDPADSFARLSRAVRLTLALEATVEDQLSALRAGEMDRAAPSPVVAAVAPVAVDDDDLDDYRDLPRDYPSAHRNKVRDAVFDVINGEVTDVYVSHEVLDNLYERLTESERYDAFGRLPLREAVEAICEDLGLQPDWSLWTDDGWSPPPPGPRYAWQRNWAPPNRRRMRQRRLQ